MPLVTIMQGAGAQSRYQSLDVDNSVRICIVDDLSDNMMQFNGSTVCFDSIEGI